MYQLISDSQATKRRDDSARENGYEQHMNAEVLVDPKSRQTEIDISRLEHDEAEHLLRLMMLIRHSEHKLAQMKKEGMIGGPVHLGVGQEAIAAGMITTSQRV